MKKITRKAIVIAIIAGLLVLCDSMITKILKQNGSFTWIAFVSWTVFWGETVKGRSKAIVGYIIGFLAAIAIINLGSIFSFMNISSIALGSILATVIVNFICIELENLDRFFPISISGIFLGIAMTFSGLGIGLTPNNFKSSMLMLTIILVYGILGLLSGWATLKFGIKEESKEN